MNLYGNKLLVDEESKPYLVDLDIKQKQCL